MRRHASARYPKRPPCTLTGQRDSPRLSESLTTQNDRHPPPPRRLNCRLGKERPVPEGGARGEEAGGHGTTCARAARRHTPAAQHTATAPPPTPRPRSRHGRQGTKRLRQLLRPARRSPRRPRPSPPPGRARRPAEPTLRWPPRDAPRPPQTPPSDGRGALPRPARTHRLTTPVLILICLKRGSAMAGLAGGAARVGGGRFGGDVAAPQLRYATPRMRHGASLGGTTRAGAGLPASPRARPGGVVRATVWRRPHSDQRGRAGPGAERSGAAFAGLRRPSSRQVSFTVCSQARTQKKKSANPPTDAATGVFLR